MNRKRKFLGLLSNGAEALIGLRLAPNLMVTTRRTDHVLDLLADLEGLPHFELAGRMENEFHCTSDDGKYVFVIHGELVRQDGANHDVVGAVLQSEQNRSRIERHIEQSLALLRLFGDGYPAMPAYYIYYRDGDRWEPDGSSLTPGVVKFAPCQISSAERPALRAFLRDFRLPLNYDYLELAFEHFQESFVAPNERIEFLSLMIAAEIIFNDGQSELRYRIARGVAVLHGASIEESEQLFSRMRKLYDIRSGLVHTGSAKGFSTNAVAELRDIVRRSIRTVAQLEWDKSALSRHITGAGFGSAIRPAF